jgi:hypothetical protein
VDQEERGSIFDVTLSVSPGPNWGFTWEFRPDMLGGIMVLKHKGKATPKPLSEEPLYRPLEGTAQSKPKEVTLTFIPYYAWANRLPGAMEVWIPYASGSRVAATKGPAAARNDAGVTP